MAGEGEIAAARAYVAQLRDAGVPAAAPLEGATAGELQPGAPALANALELERAAQPLELVANDDALELRDRAGAYVFGRLADVHGWDVCAHTAEGVYRLAFERGGQGWAIIARSTGDGSAVAAFYRGWRPGGDVWITPDLWYTLRWTPLAKRTTWRLTAEGDEILRVRTVARDHLEIITTPFAARPVLVALLICWVVIAETLPPSAIVLQS